MLWYLAMRHRRAMWDIAIFELVMFVSSVAFTPYNVNPNTTNVTELEWQARGWCIQKPLKLEKLRYKGTTSAFKLAQGVWQSPEPVAAAIKYFLEEQLNVEVDLLPGSSSQGILQNIANCTDYTACQQGLNDIESYPPPAWAAAEVWTSGAAENFLATTYCDVVSSVGYRTYPGMYMYRRTYDNAIANNFTIRWYESLKQPEAMQYFTNLSVLDPILRNVSGCNTTCPRCVPGDDFYDKLFGDYRSGCDNRGWWLAPACRNNPDTCIPVILWVPEWNAGEMAAAAVQSNLPLAITWLGFVGAGLLAIPTLFDNPSIHILFYWWSTDRTFGEKMSGNDAPVMVNFAQEEKPKLLQIDQVQLPDIVVWKNLKRVDEVVYDAWKKIKIPQVAIDKMLDDRANGKDPKDIACAWMQSMSGSQIWEAWKPDLSDCKTGYYYNPSSASARDKCVLCDPGRFSDERGQTECAACPVGRYQIQGGQDNCIACQPGAYATGGAKQCTACDLGTYTASTESISCQSCETVLVGSTSIDQGSAESSSCVCKAGYYMPLATLTCKPCPSGMTCPTGSQELGFTDSSVNAPVLDPGHWTSKAAPLFVYRCLPATHCPGISPESCKAGRIGLACGLCDENSVVRDSGCAECAGSDVLLAIIGILFLIMFPIILYSPVNAPHHWKLAPREALMITVEVIFELLQVCASITLMDIDWPNFAFDLVKFIGIFQIEIADLLPLPCIFTMDKDIPLYIASCMIVPGLVLVTIILHPLCAHVLPRVFTWFAAWDPHGTFNFCGKIVNILFISQVMLSMVPMQCYSHPNGKESSVRAFPSTLCGSGDWGVMLAVGLFSLLLCVVSFAYLCWELYRAPRMLSGEYHGAYMKRITFMVEDFQLRRYWWNIIAKLQELFLGMVILFDANNTRIQLAVFMMVFVCSLLLWARHWPYKLPLLNFMASVTFGILIMVLLLGTNKLEVSNEAEDDFSEAVLTVFLIFAFVILLGTLSLVIANLMITGKHGEVLFFVHLQRVPPVAALCEYWEDVCALDRNDMEIVVNSWEHHERMFLLRVLVQLHVPGLGSRHQQALSQVRMSQHQSTSTKGEDSSDSMNIATIVRKMSESRRNRQSIAEQRRSRYSGEAANSAELRQIAQLNSISEKHSSQRTVKISNDAYANQKSMVSNLTKQSYLTAESYKAITSEASVKILTKSENGLLNSEKSENGLLNSEHGDDDADSVGETEI